MPELYRNSQELNENLSFVGYSCYAISHKQDWTLGNPACKETP